MPSSGLGNWSRLTGVGHTIDNAPGILNTATVVSATINNLGTSLTIVFSNRARHISTSGGFTLHIPAGTPTLTYTGGNNTTTNTYGIGATVLTGNVCTLDYDGSGSIVQGTLYAFTGMAVTNNSIQ